MCYGRGTLAGGFGSLSAGDGAPNAINGIITSRFYPYQELHTLWAAMPRPKTGDKRAAILRAATKTIAEDGIGASTASIAKAAAVAEGSLFRYFPDKDKLLNELYRELKRDMRNAMIAAFPSTGSLRKRVQHIWNAYVTWGMESAAKRRAMMQLTVSERITDQSRQEGHAGFEDATEAIQQLVARGKLSGLPPAFASDLLLAMAETTMASMVANPAKAATRHIAKPCHQFESSVNKVRA